MATTTMTTAGLRPLLVLLLLSTLLLLLPTPAAAIAGRPPHWVHLATSGTGSVVLAAAFEDGVYLSKNSGQTFARAPIASNCSLCTGCQFSAVAASSNGNLLFAAGIFDGIYRSIDAGATWSRTNAPTLAWQQSLACSSSGQYVYALTPTCPGTTADRMKNACTMYGVWRSTNNGAHWARTGAQALNWKAVAASADGQRVVAAAAGNGIYTSPDFGQTWNKTLAPGAPFISLAVSSDAARVVAVAYGDLNVYLGSGTFGPGMTWTRKPVYVTTSAPWQPWINGSIHSWHNWRVAASSAVGDRLAFVSNYGFFYSSKNNGTNIDPNAGSTPAKGGVAWTAGWEWWSALAGSADGKVLYAAEVVSGSLWTSVNYGAGAWTKLSIPAVTC